MQSLHLIHALTIALLASFLSLLYRHRLRLSSNNYVLFWLWACITWVVYYAAKYLAARLSIDSPDTMEPVRSLWFAIEFSLNAVNSAFILAAAFVLSSQAESALFWGFRFRLVGLIVGAVCAGGILGLLIRQMIGLSLEDWLFINSFASSFMGGVVLVLFYHRLTQREGIPSRLSALALIVFFGYAYLQAWYPYLVFDFDHSKQVIKGIYIAALLLKCFCTVIVFQTSNKTDPAPQRKGTGALG